jgi:uncharacterized protein (TIGR03083 family)
MPTQLSLDDHLEALARSGETLRAAAGAAGLDAKVPTCPAWDVSKLVIHQGMVHRWAAANLRGDADYDTSAAQADGGAAADLLGWYSAGLGALLDTIRATPPDAKATVFLRDAPEPRRFWARRQAHETTIHSVDAIAARHGRWVNAADVELDPRLAADGIDELLTGFITRGKGRMNSERPYAVLVRTTDTGHTWALRISDGPIVTTPGEVPDEPEAILSGTATGLYLSLWNRADEITVDGRPGFVDEWRSQVQVRWS